MFFSFSITRAQRMNILPQFFVDVFRACVHVMNRKTVQVHTLLAVHPQSAKDKSPGKAPADRLGEARRASCFSVDIPGCIYTFVRSRGFYASVIRREDVNDR